MLKQLLVLCCVAMCMTFGYAQGPQRECATHTVHEQMLATNPEYRANRETIESQFRKYIQSGATAAVGGIRTIPVYVHVIYSTSQQNISNAQIESQISVLNEDFRAINSDVSQVPSEFSGSVADYEIEFELVQITRKSSTRSSWGTNDAMKKSSQGGVDPINPDTHLNMWVCNIGGGILGYAQFPGGPASTDGVVISPQYFGSSDYGSFYLSAPFDKGRTTTHEVGHYLNLRHIWGDGGCSVDDFVSDTPTAGAPNYGCPGYPSKSCSSNGGYTSDMFMNYMDYVDDECMFMFSDGQKTRTASIFAPGGSREDLGYVGAGCNLTAPGGLASSSIGDTQFTLTWSAVSGAASYDVSIEGAVSTVSGTSFTASGLTAGTSYTCNVSANCSDGGSGAVSSDLVVTTTGSNCATGPAELILTFDNYPSETSWTLTRDGSTVASGSGYSTSGQTITETFGYGSGDYVFTINDSYGDGICCSYGNGSWLINDSNGSAIASGGSFSSSESASYCIDGGGDSQSPTAPGSLAVSNVTQTSADLSWAASSDNVGVTGYDIYVDGSVDGTSTSTSYTVSGLTAGNTYAVSVVAKDAAGNESSASSTNLTTQSAGTTTVTLSITLDNYPEETSWEILDGSTVIASGGTYGSQPDGSTITESIELGDGCYDFVIDDSYGDGICCSYGNGSYQLTSGGTALASGGSFGSSETTNFCVGSGVRAGKISVTSDGSQPAGFSVFPNPTSGKLSIYSGKMESPEYIILNTAGRVWQRGNLVGNLAEISIDNLKAGMYFIRVSDGENTIVHKVVKQ